MLTLRHAYCDQTEVSAHQRLLLAIHISAPALLPGNGQHDDSRLRSAHMAGHPAVPLRLTDRNLCGIGESALRGASVEIQSAHRHRIAAPGHLDADRLGVHGHIQTIMNFSTIEVFIFAVVIGVDVDRGCTIGRQIELSRHMLILCHAIRRERKRDRSGAVHTCTVVQHVIILQAKLRGIQDPFYSGLQIGFLLDGRQIRIGTVLIEHHDFRQEIPHIDRAIQLAILCLAHGVLIEGGNVLRIAVAVHIHISFLMHQLIARKRQIVGLREQVPHAGQFRHHRIVHGIAVREVIQIVSGQKLRPEGRDETEYVGIERGIIGADAAVILRQRFHIITGVAVILLDPVKTVIVFMDPFQRLGSVPMIGLGEIIVVGLFHRITVAVTQGGVRHHTDKNRDAQHPHQHRLIQLFPPDLEKCPHHRQRAEQQNQRIGFIIPLCIIDIGLPIHSHAHHTADDQCRPADLPLLQDLMERPGCDHGEERHEQEGLSGECIGKPVEDQTAQLHAENKQPHQHTQKLCELLAAVPLLARDQCKILQEQKYKQRGKAKIGGFIIIAVPQECISRSLQIVSEEPVHDGPVIFPLPEAEIGDDLRENRSIGGQTRACGERLHLGQQSHTAHRNAEHHEQRDRPEQLQPVRHACILIKEHTDRHINTEAEHYHIALVIAGQNDHRAHQRHCERRRADILAAAALLLLLINIVGIREYAPGREDRPLDRPQKQRQEHQHGAHHVMLAPHHQIAIERVQEGGDQLRVLPQPVLRQEQIGEQSAQQNLEDLHVHHRTGDMLRPEKRPQQINQKIERRRQIVLQLTDAHPVMEIPGRQIPGAQTVYDPVVPHDVLLLRVRSDAAVHHYIISEHVIVEDQQAARQHNSQQHQHRDEASLSRFSHFLFPLSAFSKDTPSGI